jgi:hypothetical protein
VCNLKDRLDPTFTGYLGAEHRGMILENLDRGIEDVKPAVKQEELNDRLDLLTKLDDAFRGKYRAPSTLAHQSNYRRAFDLMRREAEGVRPVAGVGSHPEPVHAPSARPNDPGANGGEDFEGGLPAGGGWSSRGSVRWRWC